MSFSPWGFVGWQNNRLEGAYYAGQKWPWQEKDIQAKLSVLSSRFWPAAMLQDHFSGPSGSPFRAPPGPSLWLPWGWGPFSQWGEMLTFSWKLVNITMNSFHTQAHGCPRWPACLPWWNLGPTSPQPWLLQATLLVKNLPFNAGDDKDMGSIPGSGRSPGGGHGNPLEYSCLKNPMDRGAWRATVHGVTKGQTRLSN